MTALIGISATDTYANTTEGKTATPLTESTGPGGEVWVAIQASAAIGQYDAVGIDENGQAAPLTKAMADDGWMIAFAQTAFADNDYGWVQRKGKPTVNLVGVSTTADLPLYTTATAGSLSPTATSQTLVRGLVATVDAGSTDKTAVACFAPNAVQSGAF